MISFNFDYRNTDLHYLTFYNSLFKNYKNKEINIATLLCLNSNSLLELNKYFINANIYGYEYNDLYINYFKNKYLINNDKIKLSKIDFKDGYRTRKLFNSNTESSESYIPLSKNKLIVKYDIVISNITNILDEQIKIIENTYKYLNPGGIFIVENIFENYNEDEYLYKLSHILNEFKKYYFVSFNNIKIFVLFKKLNKELFSCIHTPEEPKKITIITPSIRPKNLLKIRNSINFDYVNEWIIVYDGSKIKENPNLFINDLNHDKIKEYIYTGIGISGNPQRNYALDNIKIKDTYLYFLDDDNEIHKDLYKLLNIADDNKLYTFNQKDRIKGNCIELFYIDTAMMLIDYNLCKDIRWILDKYNADGYYIKECYLNNTDKWIYVNNTLCTYNTII
jgi:hypothetical protein